MTARSAPNLHRRRVLRGGMAAVGLGFLAGCGVAPAPAPTPTRTYRLGVLTYKGIGPLPENRALREGLRDLGYADGGNTVIQYRFASEPEGLAASATELLEQRVEVILAAGNRAIHAVKAATGTVPIVMLSSTDPVGDGLVATLAHPGGNVTGLADLSSTLSGKRLELCREAIPRLASVAAAWDPTSGASALDWQALQEAAERLGVQVWPVEVRSHGDMMRVYPAVIALGPDLLMVLADTLFDHHERDIVRFASEARVPTAFNQRQFVAAGGLMSYGPALPALYRRAASYVDKILKGANPADLPVEQPTHFELVVNVTAAQALGLSLPESLLQQATEVIQ